MVQGGCKHKEHPMQNFETLLKNISNGLFYVTCWHTNTLNLLLPFSTNPCDTSISETFISFFGKCNSHNPELDLAVNAEVRSLFTRNNIWHTSRGKSASASSKQQYSSFTLKQWLQTSFYHTQTQYWCWPWTPICYCIMCFLLLLLLFPPCQLAKVLLIVLALNGYPMRDIEHCVTM